jgi:hypothetical protein
MESAVTAPVSGHIKRVVVHEGMCAIVESIEIWRADAIYQVIPLIKEI